ncbi:MAG: substrate-binding domain-containing protein [Alphaproteobacteria bacterium]
MAGNEASARDMMTTREVAAYLRIKERKVYDLVKSGRIPCTRVTGKWLFPKGLIDDWLASNAGPLSPAARDVRPPPVIAGSHDPLLEWCLGQSGSGLAMLPGGSRDGLARLAAGEAAICGLHLRDPATGEYNLAAVRDGLAGLGVVVVEWAWREQGLVLAPGNPLGIAVLGDLAARGARVARRQDGAGSQLLLVHLLAEAGLAPADLDLLPEPARSETELGLAVLEGKADAGLAVAAVARRLRLDFVALHRERYDLAMRRRDYFEAPFQELLAFARSAAFTVRAAELGGYDCSGLGRIVYNAP